MIDSYRRERLMLENIDLGLEKENRKLKREMTKIVKNTKTIHDLSEAATMEAAQIKSRTEKLQRSYEKEWADLFETIEEDRKAQERKRLLEMEERERKTQELLSTSQQTEGKRRMGRTMTAPFDKQLQARNEAMEKVQRYEMAFHQIRQATGMNDMDAVVTEIAEAEDANYTLFNYVNALNSDIEQLRHRISEAKGSLNASVSNDQNSTTPMEDSLVDVNPSIPSNTSSGEKDVDRLLRGVESLVRLIPDGYFGEDAEEEIAIENVEHHLACVERYVADLMAEGGDETGGGYSSLAPGRLTMSTMSIAPPSTQPDELEGLELEFFDDEKPAFGTLLRTNVAKSMERRSRPPTTDSKPTTALTRRRL